MLWFDSFRSMPPDSAIRMLLATVFGLAKLRLAENRLHSFLFIIDPGAALVFDTLLCSLLSLGCPHKMTLRNLVTLNNRLSASIIINHVQFYNLDITYGIIELTW